MIGMRCNKWFVSLACLLFGMWGKTIWGQSVYPFQDAGNPIEQRVEDIIRRMTLEEKIDLLSGYKNFNLHPCERLGIPAFHMADGPLGIASWGEYGRATAFPATLSLAASWNRDLARRLGSCYAEEWRSRGIHFMLGPGVNTYRASKSARNFEYMGEDPFLTSELVVPFIKAVQEGGVIATVKHFAANDQEFDRYRVSTEVSERALREIYFPPFKAAVQAAGVKAVMTGYNPVNGIYCTENSFLIDVLKKEWGFQGMLMSDWDCTYSENAVVNGLDMEMGSYKWLIREKLIPMVREGRISEEVINEKVRRIYRSCMEMGFFDRPQKKENIPSFNLKANRMALEVAQEGIVLLKNKDKLLPLNANEVKNIAVIGPNACYNLINDVKNTVSPICYGGGGSSRVHPWYVVSPLEGIRQEFPNANVTYAEGISSEFQSLLFQKSEFRTANGQKGLTSRFYSLGKKGKRISDSTLPVLQRVDKQVDFLWESKPDISEDLGEYYAVVWEGYIEVTQTDSLLLFVDAQGGFRLTVDDELLHDASTAPSCASCHVAVSVKRGDKKKIKLEYYNNNCLPTEVHLGYAYQGEVDFSEARRLASCADIVVFCGGLNGLIEKEGRDRPFDLPYGQELLIKELSSVNPNLVVALHAGGGVQMNSWIDKAAAILYLFYPGQEGGRAMAQILSGKVNPSAKLPFTIEKRWEDSPAYGNYDETRDERKVYYREGIFVGYRGYEKKQIQPLFPFGFGLSYTNFHYSGMDVKIVNRKEKKVKVTFTVSNIGNCQGMEIAQLYVRDEESKEERPLKELNGFEKVQLKPGESREVIIELEKDDFQYFSEKRREWVFEPGIFEIHVGTSYKDVRLKKQIKL